MATITYLEDSLKNCPEQLQSKLDELDEAEVTLKSALSSPKTPEEYEGLQKLYDSVLSARKIIKTLSYRYHKKKPENLFDHDQFS
ncbi:EscE/YscE/SsaE family type III secretion system needle protein co-chaperone [Candidatus Williamhamiltonella defendens]|uniref:Type III secretion system effector n=1 Tax=Hamiltonella defensa subsp. Acyrthosiphon pisum (strain 5AT) TaxID=572265 RepID=C4K8T1_HAMD5|nr:EscE/YscE/SsaE family type III secretion system needle protein co-chaperone [Candidatus Hamiltonella defensa]ACQ66918.1 putative type III secretion system effector [Candidatus Hamiltonella defensa 5AT (Acyrthosiphon pisum)]ATW21720.1 EscE/YscE/SsaE family type III secretion system needle protein co-chaperone [Candidatus Hamiltonella defensa]